MIQKFVLLAVLMIVGFVQVAATTAQVRQLETELIGLEQFWLSPTPNQPSTRFSGDQSGCPRMFTSALLKIDGVDTPVRFINTHLDHASDEARINGIRLVLDKINRFGGLPAVIMGDFNAEEGSETYNAVTEHFLDARYEARETMDSYTFQSWGDMEKACRIDYFMLSKTGFAVHSYQALIEPYDGIYSSDHSPIVLKISMK